MSKFKVGDSVHHKTIRTPTYSLVIGISYNEITMRLMIGDEWLVGTNFTYNLDKQDEYLEHSILKWNINLI